MFQITPKLYPNHQVIHTVESISIVIQEEKIVIIFSSLLRMCRISVFLDVVEQIFCCIEY